MGLFDLFKSAEQRRLERRKMERAAHRKAENALLTCEERIKKLELEGKKIWGEVIESLKAGQKMFAERAIKKFRWHEMIIDQLERKKFVFNKFMMQLENAETDQVFAEALSAINSVMKIDPETIINSMDQLEDKFSEQTEIDRYYGRLYEGELSKSDVSLSDRIPSMDEMMKLAEAEAAVQISSSGMNLTDIDAGSSLNVSDEIGKGREAIKKALEESEKK